MFSSRCFAGLLVLVLLPACSEDRLPGPSFSFQVALPGEPIEIDELPFPNDLLIDDEGQLHMSSESMHFGAGANQEVIGLVAAAFEDDDCYGSSTGVILPMVGLGEGDALDPATLDDSSVRMIDLQTGESVPIETHVRARQQQLYVRARIGTALAEGHTYAVIVQDGVALLSGQPLSIARDLRVVLADETSTDPRLQSARRAYAPLREFLANEPLSRSSILAASVFTTCDFSGDMQAIRSVLDARPAPVLTLDQIWRAGAELDGLLGTPASDEPGFGHPDGVAHSQLAYLVRGTFSWPNFQSSTPNKLGSWQRASNGAPMAKGEDLVPLTIAIPAGLTSYADMPVVIFQHGLNGASSQLVSVANTLAARGIATIGIDIPFHGERYPRAVDNKHNFTGLAEPDGITDDTGPSPVLYLFDLLGDENVAALDPRVMTAGFAQGAIDVFGLVSLIESGDFGALVAQEAALDGISFQSDRIVYSSESFGGLIGTVALAFEPRLRAAFLAVAGGGVIADLVEKSPEVGDLFLPVLGGTFDVPLNQLDPLVDPAHTHRAFQLMGTLMSRSDPLAYATRLRERQIHMVLAAAYSDEIVSNQSSEALAAALGLPWLEVPGVVESGPRYLTPGELSVSQLPASNNVELEDGPRTQGFFELDPASHGMLTIRNGHRNYAIGFPPATPLADTEEFDNPTTELQTMLADFAESYIATGTPSLPAP